MTLNKEIRFVIPKKFISMVDKELPFRKVYSNTSKLILIAVMIHLEYAGISKHIIEISVMGFSMKHASAKHSRLLNTDNQYKKIFLSVNKIYKIWTHEQKRGTAQSRKA